MDDIYNHDTVIVRNDLQCRPPRYYDSIYDDHDHNRMLQLKSERRRKALILSSDSSPERLIVREKCKQLQINKLKRGIENA